MKFWKVILASIIGGLITIFLVSLFFGAIIGGLVASFSTEEVEEVGTPTVLKLNPNYDIPERSTAAPMPVVSATGIQLKEAVGLRELEQAIHYAATDDRVKGVWLDLGMAPAGYATYEALREALQHLKEQGKFIYAYGTGMNEKSLYLGALADSSWLAPGSFVEFNGMAAQPVFIKNALDKLGVKMQVFYYGKYKSATELFRRTDISEANREQLRAYLKSVYTHYLNGLAADLGTSIQRLDSLADQLAVFQGREAVTYGLVDATGFIDDVKKAIAQKIDTKPEDIHYQSIDEYYKSVKDDLQPDFNDNWVAVVFMNGDVVDGPGQNGAIGATTYRKLLADIKDNPDVRAVVLRINTPGGSAISSAIIHNAVASLPDSIPVVVSMGDVCASAGYHISVAGDLLLAEPNTITGSIGVFGLFPNMKELLNEHLGITTDTVLTGPYADFGNVWREMYPQEKTMIQEAINESYEDFVMTVAQGRGMDSGVVAGLAQGRIYSGLQAVENGLVDHLGGLRAAIDSAATSAGLTKYYVREYPQQKDFIEQFVASLNNEQALLKADWSSMPVGEQLQWLWKIRQKTGIQYRMPYNLMVH